MFISSYFNCPVSAVPEARESASERVDLALQFSLIFYNSYLILGPYTTFPFYPRKLIAQEKSDVKMMNLFSLPLF